MNEKPDNGVDARSLAALFVRGRRKPSAIDPDTLFSDFPPFRSATDNMHFWPDLLSNSAKSSTSALMMSHVSLITLFKLANPETREDAVLDDLIDSARKSWGAFQCLLHLVVCDLKRPGAPNMALREWAAIYINRKIEVPSNKAGKRPHIAVRGIFLSTLIAHAERKGFRPHTNKAAKYETKPNGFEIVRSALSSSNWRFTPTISTLESVWGEHQNFVVRNTEQPAKRLVSELGVHPESLLATMITFPSEKVK